MSPLMRRPRSSYAGPRRFPKGGPDLFEAAFGHDRDPGREAHRLSLIVSDVQERDPDLVVDRVKLDQHSLAQLEVERGERLVEEQHVRVVDEGTGDRDTLFLTAADLLRLLRCLIFQLGQRQQSRHLFVDAPSGPSRHARAESDVLAVR